ncbi:MAG: hypothetical protein J6X78_01585 [Treponema sp.]|nr:hypothetical protein [Treponema sp.]
MLLLQNARQKYSELSEIIARVEQELKNAPTGTLRLSKSHKSIQYFKVEGQKNRVYIQKKNLKTAQKLAQRDYLEKLLVCLKKNLKVTESVIKKYNPESIYKCFSKLPLARRILVKPFVLSPEEYAQQWQHQEYEHKPEAPEGNLETMKGENVRSKSEVIIANLLKTHNIPYHYEYPIQIRRGQTFYADFLCLNSRTRQEFYWEHCGRMDDPEYTTNMIARLNEYAKKGIIPGKNLILTMETAEIPLNTKDVERMIETFLL